MDNRDLLIKVVFFKELDPAELVDILAISQNESYDLGQKVLAAGSPGDALYVVKSGGVMVKDGAVVLATLGVGDTVGEMSFVDREEHSASVVAMEDTTLLKICCRDLNALLAKEPIMAAKIYRAIATVLSQRLRTMDTAMHSRLQPVPR
jgi:CRP-like cAMP-binding protein